MAENSFDIVSEYDIQELKNALDQAQREISTRYDFKGSSAKIEHAEDELVLSAESATRLNAVIEILKHKLAKRNVSLKTLDLSKPVEQAAGDTIRQHVPLRKGLNQEQAKKLTKLIRDKHPKIKTQIQGEAVRVAHKDKDELQAVMQTVKSADLDIPLQFVNYR